MKQLASKPLLVLCAMLVAGCSDSMGPKGADYTLVTIDGRPMPVSFNGIDASTTVESGTLHLDADGYAIEILRISETGMIATGEHTEITYHRTVIAAPELKLIPLSCSDTCTVEATGQISGPTITLSFTPPQNGSVYTYQGTESM